MKTLALLATVIAGSLFLAPQAHAAKAGKLVGKYSGGGTLTDKRSAPVSTYLYTFSDLKLKLTGNGKISGSATVTASISSFGGPFMVITVGTLSVTGKAENIKVSKAKTTATGQLKFSDGTEVHGTFSVGTKTGKGSFQAKESTPEFDVDFKVTKGK
jgi:hypothetical protein